MRMTIQYAVILDAVKKLHCHATAEEVYTYVTRTHPHISKGTVYRNLNRLAELGEIRRRELPGGADGYDERLDAHYHARCQRCGRLFDVDMEYQADLTERIRDTHGFLFTGNDIIFTCICPDCQT